MKMKPSVKLKKTSSEKVIGEHPTLSVVVEGAVSQKKGKLLKFKGEPAVVRVSMGSTLNMGNYQSLRLGVDLALPCDPAAIDNAFDRASKFVEKKLNELVVSHTPKVEEDESLDEVEL
jgi:hypothetical protein